MADFSQYVKTANSPTVYGISGNQAVGFESEQQFLNSGGNFNNIQTVGNVQNPIDYSQWVSSRTVPVSLNASTTTNTNVLNQPPVTGNDIQSLLAQNMQFQQTVLGQQQNALQYFQATPEEQAAGQKLNSLQTQGEQLQSNVNDQIMRLGVQPGVTTAVASAQQNEAARQGQYALQTNAIQQSGTARTLQALQSNRQNLLQASQAQAQIGLQGQQFAQQNIAQALQMKQIENQEQAAALKMALENNITKPFFLVGNTVYDTGSGKPFTSQEDFVARTGMTTEQAGQKGLIQTEIETPEDRAFKAQQEQLQFERGMDEKRFQLELQKFGQSLLGDDINTPGNPEAPSSYQLETNQHILDSVDALLPKVGLLTVGLGGRASSGIPGTSAYNFNAQLQTLKSNIAFGALTQMREASKTGGALGQISDKENELLSATLGSLDVGQSPSEFKAQLEKIKASIERWNAAVNALGGATGTTGTTSSGIKYEILDDSNQVKRKFESPYQELPILPKVTTYIPQGPLATSKPAPFGVVAGYDITNYATDPNHEKAVFNFYKTVPELKTPANVDKYLQSLAPGTPIRAKDLLDAAKQYNVDAKLMVALMRQDSSLGTAGKAVRTRNPGNVGNTDSGGTQTFKTWRDGVFAVAKNLSKRKVKVIGG